MAQKRASLRNLCHTTRQTQLGLPPRQPSADRRTREPQARRLVFADAHEDQSGQKEAHGRHE
jgi:hypothetical protein